MKHDKFFFFMSLLIFLIMLIGFAPSFFFRSMVHRGPMPPLFIIHSVLNVAWLVALITQSWLAMNNKIVNHKRNGIYWFLLSILVVIINLLIIHKAAQKPIDTAAPPLTILGPIVGNSFVVIFFIFYVGASYFFRHVPAIHKRLLLFITIGMLGPALGRIHEYYEPLRFTTMPVLNMLVYDIGVQLAMYFSILVYDLITRKKPHFITLFCILMNFLATYLFFLVVSSGAGMKYVEFLKSI